MKGRRRRTSARPACIRGASSSSFARSIEGRSTAAQKSQHLTARAPGTRGKPIRSSNVLSWLFHSLFQCPQCQSPFSRKDAKAQRKANQHRSHTKPRRHEEGRFANTSTSFDTDYHGYVQVKAFSRAKTQSRKERLCHEWARMNIKRDKILLSRRARRGRRKILAG